MFLYLILLYLCLGVCFDIDQTEDKLMFTQIVSKTIAILIVILLKKAKCVSFK